MTTFVDMQDLMLSVVSNNNKLGDRGQSQQVSEKLFQ